MLHETTMESPVGTLRLIASEEGLSPEVGIELFQTPWLEPPFATRLGETFVERVPTRQVTEHAIVFLQAIQPQIHQIRQVDELDLEYRRVHLRGRT